jgi:hypothetical protein
MSIRITVATVVACCSVAACASRQVHVTSSPGEATTSTTSLPAPASGASAMKWNTTLAPQGAGTVAGTATVAPGTTAGTTVVAVVITGGTPGAIYPWHVHTGNCGEQGPVVGSAAAYPVLTADAAGKAQANATIPVTTPTTGNYYVNVHASPSDMGTIISCGNLSAAGM